MTAPGEVEPVTGPCNGGPLDGQEATAVFGFVHVDGPTAWVYDRHPLGRHSFVCRKPDGIPLDTAELPDGYEVRT